MAHENVRKRLSTRQINGVRKKATEPALKKDLPSIVFDLELTIYFNDEEVSIIHLPQGHTDGDAVVYFNEANVLHTGDLFFKDHNK